VYCRADVEVAFRRATEQRGSAWGRGIADHVRSWRIPQYPEAPLKNEQDVVRFWSWLDEETRRLMDRWPGEALTLEATNTTRDELARQLLGHLGLDELPLPPPPSPERLQEYVGLYTRVSDPEPGDPIVVELQTSTLFANLYWPAGSSLVAEGDDVFRLQSTSRTVRFHRDGSGLVDGLIYTITWQGEEFYARVKR
jgi:hypothetical protein